MDDRRTRGLQEFSRIPAPSAPCSGATGVTIDSAQIPRSPPRQLRPSQMACPSQRARAPLPARISRRAHPSRRVHPSRRARPSARTEPAQSVRAPVADSPFPARRSVARAPPGLRARPSQHARPSVRTFPSQSTSPSQRARPPRPTRPSQHAYRSQRARPSQRSWTSQRTSPSQRVGLRGPPSLRSPLRPSPLPPLPAGSPSPQTRSSPFARAPRGGRAPRCATARCLPIGLRHGPSDELATRTWHAPRDACHGPRARPPRAARPARRVTRRGARWNLGTGPVRNAGAHPRRDLAAETSRRAPRAFVTGGGTIPGPSDSEDGAAASARRDRPGPDSASGGTGHARCGGIDSAQIPGGARRAPRGTRAVERAAWSSAGGPAAGVSRRAGTRSESERARDPRGISRPTRLARASRPAESEAGPAGPGRRADSTPTRLRLRTGSPARTRTSSTSSPAASRGPGDRAAPRAVRRATHRPPPGTPLARSRL